MFTVLGALLALCGIGTQGLGSARGQNLPLQSSSQDLAAVRSDQAGPTPFSSEAIFRPIDQIDLDDTPSQGLDPPDYSAELFVSADETPLAGQTHRNWPIGVLEWSASELESQPLYFDDVPLERYGQTHCRVLQPAISAARFFGTFPAIPYKMAIDHPYDRVSALGLWRPGSPTPCIHQSLPWECQAAAWEGAAWAGLILLLP